MVILTGISGSLRRGSHNSALLRAAAAMMPPDSRRPKATNRQKRGGKERLNRQVAKHAKRTKDNN